MTVIAVISPKGGVGKTTVTVNLACALAKMGHPGRLIDLDPQNALRLHLGAHLSDVNGLVHQTLQHSNWRNAEYGSDYGVSFIPYGRVSEGERVAFEAHLAQNPSWLKDNLAMLGGRSDELIFVDTPPGPSVYAQHALAVANIILVVMIPDAGSYATLSSIEDLLQYYCSNRPDFYGSYYILNQFDAAHNLNRDIQVVMQNTLGERLVPHSIHRDESLSEALAYQQPVRQYAPYSQAVDDIDQISLWLEGLVNQLSGTSYAVGR